MGKLIGEEVNETILGWRVEAIVYLADVELILVQTGLIGWDP